MKMSGKRNLCGLILPCGNLLIEGWCSGFVTRDRFHCYAPPSFGLILTRLVFSPAFKRSKKGGRLAGSGSDGSAVKAYFPGLSDHQLSWKVLIQRIFVPRLMQLFH
jgi:hypothetical protein